MGWRLTERAGPEVQRRAFADLDGALDALEDRVRELSLEAPDRVVDAKFKRFEPVEQVVARLELSGPQRLVPSVRAGIDVHGDGSLEAYRGRVRRSEIAPDDSETALEALRRTVTQLT